MLENTEERESNSALAALSLIRSVGTAIAPAIMVGFIAHAGGMVQGNVMALLPQELQMPPLPYAQEITDEVNALKASGQMGDQLAGIPDLTAMERISLRFDSDSGYEMSPALLSLMQNSDVTTITANTKTLSASMFDEMSPRLLAQIDAGLSQGIDGIAAGEARMQASIAQMEAAGASAAGLRGAVAQMEDLSAKMTVLENALPGAFAAAEADYLAQIDDLGPALESAFQTTLNTGFRNVYLTAAIAACAAEVFLLFYRGRKRGVSPAGSEQSPADA